MIRPTSIGIAAAWFGVVGSAVWGIVVVPILVVFYPPSSGADTVVIVLLDEVLAALIGWYAWRATALAIVATDDGLLVHNILRHRRIPIEETEGFEVGSGYFGVSVRLRNGRSVILTAVQKSNAARWLRLRGRADDVVDQLNRWLSDRRAAGGATTIT